MIQKIKMAALLLPLLVPALLTGKIMYERAQAPIYQVRIEGYDPRDLLYGHYLMFRFAPEKSQGAEHFPKDMAEKLQRLQGRYYIPEEKAATLDRLLRDQGRIMAIDVGVPTQGKAFMGDLYIDGQPMPAFLREFEDRVDLNGDVEGQ